MKIVETVWIKKIKSPKHDHNNSLKNNFSNILYYGSPTLNFSNILKEKIEVWDEKKNQN
jgi:hypothetical protein